VKTPTVITLWQGDDTWLINSPEAVAQAVKTRFELWYGQWFLDTTEGHRGFSPYSVSRSRKPTTWLSVSASSKRGALNHSLFQYHSEHDDAPRQFFAEIDTIYGTTTVTSEA
jgi:hypothetical protein